MSWLNDGLRRLKIKLSRVVAFWGLFLVIGAIYLAIKF
jgi:hypothetical protein